MDEASENRVAESLRAICMAARDEGLKECLLIGGNAVIAHGVPRFTRDLDFAIPERLAAKWRGFLEREGYPLAHGTSAFMQFQDEEGKLPRVDLMIVDEATWGKLISDAWDLDLGESNSFRVVSPQHLIAMKLKAYLSEHRREDAVDWRDIVELTIHHQFDPVNDAKFAEFVIQFGGVELHKKLVDEIATRRDNL